MLQQLHHSLSKNLNHCLFLTKAACHQRFGSYRSGSRLCQAGVPARHHNYALGDRVVTRKYYHYVRRVQLSKFAGRVATGNLYLCLHSFYVSINFGS